MRRAFRTERKFSTSLVSQWLRGREPTIIMRPFGGCNFQLSTMPQRNYVAVAILIGIALGGMAHAQAPVRITLEQAIDLAISHNHALKAAKLQIQQGQAQEVTASLRPNPTLTWDALFLPVQPQNFN